MTNTTDTPAVWRKVEPEQRGPWIAGDDIWRTHVLAENERGERYFVNRNELAGKSS